MKNKPIATNSPEGQEIVAYLRKKLGIPDYCNRISVHLNERDVIRVECAFIPAAHVAEYKIVED